MASADSHVSRDGRRAELREFLRSRRARVSPADVGMPAGGRRRTPGLRREEVAVLAGVGVSWYTWLEQGRDIKVSEQVLDAIARVLLLDAAERTHLYRLAGLNPPQAPSQPSSAPSPEVRRLLESWSPRPGYIRDRHWNFTAVNDAARVVFGYRENDHNCLVSFFTNLRYRVMHRHWAEAAPEVAAAFRADAARYPDDPEFERIAADLAAVSPEFADLWARHDAAEHTSAVKAVDHPEAGTLVFDATLLPLPDRPGHHLILHNPRPGTDTEQRVETLMQQPNLVVPHPG
ncbi:helix-turn-helix transcriptional regulator [Streptomyces sp. NBC_01799]|uniref:helix-turn-helix transcriptional regulator n=1 Tax=Streptomyces sp. NBC_01800 TaxID=2975945 RepID=UPI002DDBB4F9|nr:helix-turn-helix transcriptional regulator [Streptomyces sp. NBC_01800]WSA65612.1 helix-turn-helix transcriptional regulator [Streptomyces sp. NBC_01800]WSA73505.1 helix-turn-helix transcriptional regulator [Streptomyces sp. NBC_01800]WSA74225.1 helix-turn-helix transcriptional regulator [Streptomyces sp. NBC_01799]WSA82022.1 helix-turn-helix transcriptional regulator [Streptomyces sp. NBC_01799]